MELLLERSAPGQNRGFCFLEYRNHAAALKAKAALSDSSFRCAAANTGTGDPIRSTRCEAPQGAGGAGAAAGRCRARQAAPRAAAPTLTT